MDIILSLIGIASSILLIKYRERMGDMIGDAYWMRHVGGVYNLIIIFAVFIFFWSIAELTGTTDIILEPLKWLVPGQGSLEETL